MYITAPDIAIKRGVWGRKGVEGWERKSLEAQASSACSWEGISFAGNAYPNACIPAMQPAVCVLCANISITTTIRSIHIIFGYSIMRTDVGTVVVIASSSR